MDFNFGVKWSLIDLETKIQAMTPNRFKQRVAPVWELENIILQYSWKRATEFELNWIGEGPGILIVLLVKFK